MIRLEVKVDDWDTGETTILFLPCSLNYLVDTSHELEIVDCVPDVRFGYGKSLTELNDLLDEINIESPEMTAELLDTLLEITKTTSLDNEEFFRKICERDYMFDEVSTLDEEDNESCCAAFLFQTLNIPFAKNITDSHVSLLMKKEKPWATIWSYYYRLGFRAVEFDGSLYIMHWGNSAR